MLLNRSQCVFYKGPGSHGFVFEDCLHLAAEAASQLLKQAEPLGALQQGRTLHSPLCSKGIREDIRVADIRGSFGHGPADHVTLLACAGVYKKRKTIFRQP